MDLDLISWSSTCRNRGLDLIRQEIISEVLVKVKSKVGIEVRSGLSLVKNWFSI